MTKKAISKRASREAKERVSSLMWACTAYTLAPFGPDAKASREDKVRILNDRLNARKQKEKELLAFIAKLEIAVSEYREPENG